MEQSNSNKLAILNEIASHWKLEAKLEDNKRYFYHTNELNKILSGEKCYVIGRKGTGKTALSEYLLNNNPSEVFTEKLNFKNFPFNELYSLHNENYTPPNQYITIWKYIIYSFICRMFVKNDKINLNIRQKLNELYKTDSIDSLSRVISKWTKREFGATILGSGFYRFGERY